MWREEKKKRQEVEGENTIIKGIGNNSPEMKLMQKEVEALKTQLYADNEKAQRRIKELEQDNKIKDEEIGRLYNKIR
tara:strand:+ start:198 stop:428 length:231 start_codon:yes stop_codon:yes gene_type:complete